MHFLLIYELAEDYLERRGAHRKEHLGLVQRSFDSGQMVLAGALAEPADNAMIVFRGESVEIAERFAQSDPYVLNGLVKSWRVRKWNTVVGDGAVPPS